MTEDRSLEGYRESAIELLSDDYAADRITLDDYERLVSEVNNAVTRAEIRSAMEELPLLEDSVGSRPAEEGVGEELRVVTFLSERKLTGDWLHRDRASAVTILGESRIDLRDVDPGRREIRLNLVSILGETRIVVPADMRVETDITPLLAEVTIKGSRETKFKRRSLRLSGFAIMGEIRVEVKE